MRTRCSKCDYENDSQYHYCGMCGELLPETVSNPAPKPVRADTPIPSRDDARNAVPKHSNVNDRRLVETPRVFKPAPDPSPVIAPRSLPAMAADSSSLLEAKPASASQMKSPVVAAPRMASVESEPSRALEPQRVAEFIPVEKSRPAAAAETGPATNYPIYDSPLSVGPPRSTEFDPSARLDDNHTRTVSGPSFLGLSNEPTTDNFQYLLEDPEADSHRGRYLVLFLLIAIGMGLAWQWTHGAFPFAGRSQVALNGPATNASPSGNMSASPSEVAPAMSNNTESVPHPKTGVADPSRPDAKISESRQGNSSIPRPTNQEVGSSTPPPSTEPKAESPQSKPETAQSRKPPATTEMADTPPPPPARRTPVEKLTERPVASRETQPGITAASRTVVEKYRRSPVSSQDDALASDGEKYLYGRGVPQNCNRAQKDLLTAGQGTSAKAQSMLGAMYATGHCATRNLPTAYRWFAKSLRTDPANTRLSRNLEILWNQMTPDEKQSALQSSR